MCSGRTLCTQMLWFPTPRHLHWRAVDTLIDVSGEVGDTLYGKRRRMGEMAGGERGLT
jgi:hypothetical protein